MTRAERRRMEREQLKPKREPAVSPDAIKSALFKKQLTDKIDRELGDKYWDLACKDKTDISYELLLGCQALSLRDKYPECDIDDMAEVIQGTMRYVDRFIAEYEGNLDGFLHHVEDVTGLLITVDSKPKGQEE